MSIKAFKLSFLLFLCLASNLLSAQEVVKHTVTAGETKYGLSKQYKISVEELERQNPHIVNGLQTGQVISIGPVAEAVEAIPETPSENLLNTFLAYQPIGNAIGEVSENREGAIVYTIAEGDTKYSVSRRFHISVEDLDAMNPDLGVAFNTDEKVILNPGDGSVTLPVNKSTALAVTSHKTNTTVEAEVIPETKQTTIPVAKVANHVFLKDLPEELHKKISFVYSANYGETNTDFEDFYKGAVIALDSLKKLGIQVENNTVNAMAMTSGELAKVSSSDAILATSDVYYVNKLQEKAAESVPVVYGIPVVLDTIETSNAYFALPPKDYSQRLLLDYLDQMDANIVVINGVDASVKESFIESNYSSAKMITAPENGILEEKVIIEALQEDKLNYIVLNTERSNTILNVTNALLHNYSKYKAELASFITLDFLNDDNVSNKRFEVLKMIYPKNEEVAVSSNFENLFKSKYNLEPNDIAQIGFDVTFDTVLRMCQQDGILGTVKTSSNGSKLKFDYQSIGTSKYLNKTIDLYQLNNGKEEKLNVN